MQQHEEYENESSWLYPIIALSFCLHEDEANQQYLSIFGIEAFAIFENTKT